MLGSPTVTLSELSAVAITSAGVAQLDGACGWPVEHIAAERTTRGVGAVVPPQRTTPSPTHPPRLVSHPLRAAPRHGGGSRQRGSGACRAYFGQLAAPGAARYHTTCKP